MAVTTATYPGSSASIVNVTSAATFIPEIWSDEILAAYKKRLVVGNLVKKMSMKGKKGDVLHIPAPYRGQANLKVKGVAVTIMDETATEKTVTIDKHYEYSRLIEDIVAKQALSSLRQHYTDDAGYQLALQQDTDLIRLARLVANNGSGATATSSVYANAFIGGDGTTTYSSASTGNASALTDAAIRRSIQRLDDADAPMSERYLVVPPSSRNTLMGLSRFTEQAFVGEAGRGNTIRNGQIGDAYGVEVFVTSNCDSATVASGTAPRIALLFHKDAFVLAEQMGIRTQTQYKQEYLADLLTADTLYGVQVLRDSSTSGSPFIATAVPLVVPA